MLRFPQAGSKSHLDLVSPTLYMGIFYILFRLPCYSAVIREGNDIFVVSALFLAHTNIVSLPMPTSPVFPILHLICILPVRQDQLLLRRGGRRHRRLCVSLPHAIMSWPTEEFGERDRGETHEPKTHPKDIRKRERERRGGVFRDFVH